MKTQKQAYFHCLWDSNREFSFFFGSSIEKQNKKQKQKQNKHETQPNQIQPSIVPIWAFPLKSQHTHKITSTKSMVQHSWLTDTTNIDSHSLDYCYYNFTWCLYASIINHGKIHMHDMHDYDYCYYDLERETWNFGIQN